MQRYRKGFLRLLPILLLLTGCGRSSIEQVKVSGKVLYRGQPLPGGVVKFVSAKGFSSTATIDAEGNYQMLTPVGEMKIGVDNRMLRRTSRSSSHQMLKRPSEGTSLQPITGVYVPIPEKYASVESSGLNCTAAASLGTFNIVLE